MQLKTFLVASVICILSTFSTVVDAQSFDGLPNDLVTSVILRNADLQTVSRLGQTNRRWHNAIFTGSPGARMLWMRLLLDDYVDRFPDAQLGPTIDVARIQGDAPGVNPFFATLRDIRVNLPAGADEQAVRTAILGIHDEQLRVRFIQNHVIRIEAEQRVSWWQGRSRLFSAVGWHVGLLAFGPLIIVGNVLRPSAGGIAMMSIGGAIGVVVLGSTMYYLLVRGTIPMLEWSRMINEASQRRADLARQRVEEVADDIETQYGDLADD